MSLGVHGEGIMGNARFKKRAGRQKREEGGGDG